MAEKLRLQGAAGSRFDAEGQKWAEARPPMSRSEPDEVWACGHAGGDEAGTARTA